MLLNNGADTEILNNQYLSPIILSIINYLPQTVEILLKRRNIINNIYGKGTPIHWALYKLSPSKTRLSENRIRMVQLLLNYGANPNIKDYEGNTALHLAVKYNYQNIIELLMENRANPNIKNNKRLKPVDLTEDIEIKEYINSYESKVPLDYLYSLSYLWEQNKDRNRYRRILNE